MKPKKTSNKKETLHSSKTNDQESSDESNNSEESETEIKSNNWGKKRNLYYNTDFNDKDYSTYNENEEENAQEEEEEAKSIQQRIALEFKEDDFNFNFQPSILDNESKTTKKLNKQNQFKTNFSNLTEQQKLLICEKESPEFAIFIEEFELSINKIKKAISQTNSTKANEIFKELSLNYITQIAFYLLLKSKNKSIKKHPVIERLATFRQVLLKLENEIKQFSVSNKSHSKKNTRKSLENKDMRNEIVNENNSEELSQNRREINYQIAKNKGLISARQKQVRNPRVKHRNKYRKALIRRKGAVRTVRTDQKRYMGEISGIKATTKKGIKFKS